jgi:hypothetical protein
VYLGVGPEQYLTYIAAIHPEMAFIVDIRRQAVMQHLMFKAMFELAKDRADFISLLFSKPRPDGLDDTTPIRQIWEAYSRVATSTEAARSNTARVIERSGQPQSFLSTEENFRYVKTLHEKNLIVPVSGDFGGTKAPRAIGAYVKKQNATVSAFYVSNVEQYLFQDRKDRAFFDNVATLPTTDNTVFIRPYSLRRTSTQTQSLCPIRGFLDAVQEGRIGNNNDALACGR